MYFVEFYYSKKAKIKYEIMCKYFNLRKEIEPKFDFHLIMCIYRGNLFLAIYLSSIQVKLTMFSYRLISNLSKKLLKKNDFEMIFKDSKDFTP